jgi:molybdopterin-guanine dinucleotide biosynthesis protein A
MPKTIGKIMGTLGAVLVGGRSSRMGTDKALVEINGIPMLGRVASALSEVSSRVVVLGGKYEGFENWQDEVDPSGPLSGLVTALARAEEHRVLMVAVDHPFVRPETLSHLVEAGTDLAVVPVDDHGVRQVTCAVYPTSISDLAREEAEAGGSIQSLLDRVSFQPITPDTWQSWGEDGRSWFSVDNAEALETGLRDYI